MIVAGSKLITSDASGCICIWSIDNSPGLSHRLETHRLSVISLDSDRKRIVSGGEDGLVRLRDVESGQLLGQLGEATTVWKVGFLKGGRVALVVYREGTVTMEIWHVE
jgi:F-box and WD-40 domain protein CDC4